MSDRRRIKLRVNGNVAEREVETRMTLADFLRLAMELTGTPSDSAIRQWR
jgi:aerobic-type carbon monoxide dehydrogenase small subunit (CoxS/CutS family)